MGKQIYSREILINIVKQRANELGRTPAMSELGVYSTIVYRYFKNYQELAVEAGLKPRYTMKKKEFSGLSKEERKELCIRAIKEMIADCGLYPSYDNYIIYRDAYERSDLPSAATIIKEYNHKWGELIYDTEYSVPDAAPKHIMDTGVIISTEEIRGVYGKPLESLQSKNKRAKKIGLKRVAVHSKDKAEILRGIEMAGFPEVNSKIASKGRDFIMKLLQGNSMAAIARQEGVSRQFIDSYIKKYISIVTGEEKDTQKGKNIMRKEFDENILNLIIEAGFPDIYNRKTRHVGRELLKKAVEENKSITDLAKEEGTNYTAIQKSIRAYIKAFKEQIEQGD